VKGSTSNDWLQPGIYRLAFEDKDSEDARGVAVRGGRNAPGISFLTRVSEEGVEERHLSRAGCGLLGPVCLLQQGFSGLGDFLGQFIFVG
jgi:hypothetical protein